MHRQRSPVRIALLSTSLLAAVAFAPPGAAQTSPSTGATANFAPNEPAGEWHSQAHDYANTRYSTLDEITPENVSRLRVVSQFEIEHG